MPSLEPSIQQPPRHSDAGLVAGGSIVPNLHGVLKG
jgi:hypothetical protein